MKRLLVVVGLLLALLCPVSALASPLDGFSNGLDDMFNPKETQFVELEGSEGTKAAPSNAIMSGIQSFLTVPFSFRGNTYWRNNKWQYIADVLKIVLPIAVLFVFFWWGVRKAIRIIMNAFRSGRLSFGGRERNYNSYYYGTKPSDWR